MRASLSIDNAIGQTSLIFSCGSSNDLKANGSIQAKFAIHTELTLAIKEPSRTASNAILPSNITVATDTTSLVV